ALGGEAPAPVGRVETPADLHGEHDLRQERRPCQADEADEAIVAPVDGRPEGPAPLVPLGELPFEEQARLLEGATSLERVPPRLGPGEHGGQRIEVVPAPPPQRQPRCGDLVLVHQPPASQLPDLSTGARWWGRPGG